MRTAYVMLRRKCIVIIHISFTARSPQDQKKEISELKFLINIFLKHTEEEHTKQKLKTKMKKLRKHIVISRMTKKKAEVLKDQ